MRGGSRPRFRLQATIDSAHRAANVARRVLFLGEAAPPRLVAEAILRAFTLAREGYDQDSARIAHDYPRWRVVVVVVVEGRVDTSAALSMHRRIAATWGRQCIAI